MRKFKTTPQKKFIGMIILFVLIPIFLLAYVFLVIDWRPGADTIVIVAAIAILAFYFYTQYKKQLALQGKAEEPLTQKLVGEELLPEDSSAKDPLPEESGVSEEELVEDDLLDEFLPEEESSKKTKQGK